jgi:phosphoribosylformylglycinamidine cyclo-ligase
MSTDGVGTKILVAIRAGRHDTVGEDLVNHCVNDILVHGATPLAFLDYLAVAEASADAIAAIVEGVARGCRAHEMALVGGETAQLPDMYHPGHYDLAGTIVGIVSEAEALHGDRVEVGDVLVGYASTGLHTNGYTLARQIVFDDLGLDVGSYVGELGATIGDALLEVHRSYFACVRPVLPSIHALAHITGGGIDGNLTRSMPDGCAPCIDKDSWEVPRLFQFLQLGGSVDETEMFRVFNMGVGMIAVAPPAAVDGIRQAAEAERVATWVIGDVVRA